MSLETNSVVGERPSEATRASTSSSNSGCNNDDANGANGDDADEEGDARSPMELVSSALDHVDIVIYTVVETLQGKVNYEFCTVQVAINLVRFGNRDNLYYLTLIW